MAEFGMGGLPPMMPPMLPIGGSYGEMLSYNPGWFYGNTVASGSSQYASRRDRLSLADITPLEYIYGGNTRELTKSVSQTQKKLYDTKKLLRYHTIEVRNNYAKFLILDAISKLEASYGDLPLSSIAINDIKPDEIQQKIDDHLCNLSNEQDENDNTSENEFKPKARLSSSLEFYDRKKELKFIKSFLKTALSKRDKVDWRNDTIREIASEFNHYYSCLTVYGYHNYNVYNLLLGNEDSQSLLSEQLLPDLGDQVELKSYFEFEHQFYLNQEILNENTSVFSPNFVQSEQAYLQGVLNTYKGIKANFHDGHKLSEFNAEVDELVSKLKNRFLLCQNFLNLCIEIQEILQEISMLLQNLSGIMDLSVFNDERAKYNNMVNNYNALRNDVSNVERLEQLLNRMKNQKNSLENYNALERVQENQSEDDNLNSNETQDDENDLENTSENALGVDDDENSEENITVVDDEEDIQEEDRVSNQPRIIPIEDGDADKKESDDMVHVEHRNVVDNEETQEKNFKVSGITAHLDEDNNSISIHSDIEELNSWRDLISNYLKSYEDSNFNANRQVVSSAQPSTRNPEDEMIEMLSNIEDDEVDFSSMKGFGK